MSADERVGSGTRLQLATELAVRGGRMLLEPPAPELAGVPVALLAGNRVSHAEALAELALAAQAQSSVGGVAVGQDRAGRVSL
jgi:hypothetical protein